MPGSWPEHELPNIGDDNCQVTSKATRRYNCIAWAAGDVTRNWWPDPIGVGYWPTGAPRAETIEAFLHAYGTLGFRLCFDGSLQAAVEKVAILGKGPRGSEVPTHAALQLETGEWTSKLGPFEDITHRTLEAVCGQVYGRVICFLARPRPA